MSSAKPLSLLKTAMLCFALLLAAAASISAQEGAAANTTLYVCEAGDPLFLGTYTKSEDKVLDGAPVYTNEKDMSFFRSRNYWYLGNVAPWPPETHYRCVEIEGCGEGWLFPPSKEEGAWTASKKFGREPVPVVSKIPCPVSDEL